MAQLRLGASDMLDSDHDRRTVIRAGTLVDGMGGFPHKNKAIVIHQGLIESIVDWPEASQINGRTIDLCGRTVMPGLIDCHVHPTFNGEPNYLEMAYTKSAAYRTLLGQRNVLRDLMAGFTTVRALGERSHIDIALRDAIKEKLIVASKNRGGGSGVKRYRRPRRPVARHRLSLRGRAGRTGRQRSRRVP